MTINDAPWFRRLMDEMGHALAGALLGGDDEQAVAAAFEKLAASREPSAFDFISMAHAAHSIADHKDREGVGGLSPFWYRAIGQALLRRAAETAMIEQATREARAPGVAMN